MLCLWHNFKKKFRYTHITISNILQLHANKYTISCVNVYVFFLYQGFTEKFMTPALYDVFDEVKDSCDRNFGECLFTVYKLSRPAIVFTDQYELFRARVRLHTLSRSHIYGRYR